MVVACSSALLAVQTGVLSVCLFLCVSRRQAFPHSMLHTLPKRQALEKSNGGSPLLNPSFLHYQHALASAHLQQPAYFPTGEPPSVSVSGCVNATFLCVGLPEKVQPVGKKVVSVM